MYFNNCNTGCGCNANNANVGCGGNVKPTCANSVTNGCIANAVNQAPCYAMYPQNVNNVGCGCRNMQVTPVTLPERVNYTHCCCVHEQPVIVPVENRMVNHHTFAPRYYEVNRMSQEDVIEANPYASINEVNIYPNFLNM